MRNSFTRLGEKPGDLEADSFWVKTGHESPDLNRSDPISSPIWQRSKSAESVLTGHDLLPSAFIHQPTPPMCSKPPSTTQGSDHHQSSPKSDHRYSPNAAPLKTAPLNHRHFSSRAGEHRSCLPSSRRSKIWPPLVFSSLLVSEHEHRQTADRQDWHFSGFFFNL